MAATRSIATRSGSSDSDGEMTNYSDGPMMLDSMTGPQRAAVILLILGEDHGRVIWQEFDDEEIRIITRAMAELGTVDADQVEKLMLDFVGRLSSAGAITGSFDRTISLLEKILPTDQVALIMEEIRGPAGRNMWQKLGNIDAVVLANFLKNEYPQTIAVILSRIRPDHSANVLRNLPNELSIEVVGRMLRMEAVQKEALDHIENTLRTEFVSTLTQTRRRDPHEMMAEIFNGFDRQTEVRFLAALDATNQESAERIRALMFTFEDLGKLDSAGLQTLMRQVDKDALARALKGANEDMRAFFMGAMSQRAAKVLQDDIQGLGPLRLKEVDEAQMKMVTLAKDLAEKGEIIISKGNSEDELVY
ncbi:Flagellar motor switch protein FliG [Bosea sp. 62]|nr:Flagellar motor switch protein FliG [Bosea sp. 7B]CAD5274541.1 Flagellar motor switch protein FliG [Bosea sp. 21B]CAD5275742.1 Flagellar motor switch protein FliG [Bosea sp. 46]VVT60087.1 Flagellar motor switch protein FliG [Bosea sp. EC-HK365B]VXB54624.1 Flagellar motor switch protein FliG [Bosea sp. 62]VXC15516.1 Flagellar motor switch protein FliG [Bosea sp. 29B]VXC17008.1 Flagellar motor switch protein FliG [Bosea sp. 127]VXC69855.1 Flagellar motor switch protein FliG [Bosea sp. 125]